MLDCLPPEKPSDPGLRPGDRAPLRAWLAAIRATTENLAAPLSAEDQVVQSMADASPTKWHLAHTTWFFETLVLSPYAQGYDVFDGSFGYLFNSYYEALGPRHPRPARGLLSRPDLARVRQWRAYVSDALDGFVKNAADEVLAQAWPLLVLGGHHEQQHQELILTDILHLFSQSPLRPAYRPLGEATTAETSCPLSWIEHPGGVVEIGHNGPGFAYDNEGPRHQVLLRPFRLADRLVSNGEFQAFIDDGGYDRPEFWLSDGWARRLQDGWTGPAYWRDDDDGRALEFGLNGMRPRHPSAPVCHVSFFEADAFARWAGKRLPSEAEWEVVAQNYPVTGNFLSSGALAPLPAPAQRASAQFYGDVWEWTSSAYSPYPGFRAPQGAVGEYNGKFMVSQMVLRGGSCATPDHHVRSSYRNFFYPPARWQFSGLRLAEDG